MAQILHTETETVRVAFDRARKTANSRTRHNWYLLRHCLPTWM